MKQSTKKVLKVNILLILAMLLTACGPSGTWDEHYNLGIKYLSDGNYEEAIIEFETAIKIDDMKPKAYIGASDAYVGMEEYQKAIEILETGYEKCEDEEVYKLLQNLRFEYDALNLEETFSAWGVEDLMRLEEITLNDTPIYGMSWEEIVKNVKSIYAAYGGKYHVDEVEDGLYNGFGHDAQGVNICIYKSKNPVDGMDYFGIDYFGSSDETYLGWRGIELGENQETVLKKVGFTKEGIEYLCYLFEKKKNTEISIPFATNSNRGECVSISTQFRDNSYRLEMMYASNDSFTDGNSILFVFEKGSLKHASFYPG